MKKSLAVVVLSLVGMVWAGEPATEPQTVENVRTHEVPDTPAPSVSYEGKAPRHVILMIGDGMGLEQVCAAWVCNKGKLNITRLPVTGFSKTYSASHLVTDSAAGGTALACGQRTNNRWLGLTPERERMVSLADTARGMGMATGLVVTKAITDATPAAFYAHVDDRKKSAEIAADLVAEPFDVVTGGGAADFTAKQARQMEAAGTKLCLAYPGHCPVATQRGDFLPQKTAEALDVLEKAPKGFFLMIEGSQIDMAAHDNNLNELVAEVLDFDRALAVVLEWMESHPDTLLVVTADHQTGGLVIHSGDITEGRVTATFSTGNHNGIMVPVYAAGVGAARFSGIQHNTDIPAKIRQLLNER